LNIGLTARIWPCPFAPLKKHLGDKRFSPDEGFETEVRNWLRQQSKNLYSAGFDTLVKLLDKCINVSGGYVEK
jgi:hypothetical protein